MENDIYELFASAFYNETGMMAPGKDDPIGAYTQEERRVRWEEWIEELRARPSRDRSNALYTKGRRDGYRSEWDADFIEREDLTCEELSVYERGYEDGRSAIESRT